MRHISVFRFNSLNVITVTLNRTELLEQHAYLNVAIYLKFKLFSSDC